MVKSCCVAGCKITSTKGITYFKFPGSRSLRRKWEDALKVNGKQAEGDAICSRHFLTSDYQFVRGKTRLKAAVVPSVFAVEITKNQQKDNIPTDEQLVDSTKEILTETEKSNDKDESSEIEESVSDRIDEHKKSLQESDKDVAVGSERVENETKEKDDNIEKNATNSKDKNAINSDEIVENSPTNEDKNEESSDKKETEKHNEDAEMKIESTETKSDNKCSISDAEVNISEQSNEDIVSKQSNEIIVSKQTTTVTVSKQSSEPIASKQSSEAIASKQSSEAVVSKRVTDVSKVLDEQQDIEELLTDYHICQNNIHTLDDDIQTVDKPESIEKNLEENFPINADPVFIELSVDKEATGDCLMVLESVQVDVDPNAILQDQEFEVASVDLDNEEDDAPVPPKEPISLLTSSDEDEVIIQEPKIDTVEVSDETDEDDLPLLKLVKMKKMKKKKFSQNPPEETNKIKWGMYYCIECHFRTTDRSEYNKHRLEHSQVLLMCQLCGYMTSSEPQLLRHEKLHKDYKKYQCHLCDYRAKHQMSLNYHLKSHKAKNRFKCAKCGYKAEIEKEALKHIVFCKGLDGKRHCCDKCDYKTKKPSDLRRHKARKHKVGVSDDDTDEDYLP